MAPEDDLHLHFGDTIAELPKRTAAKHPIAEPVVPELAAANDLILCPRGLVPPIRISPLWPPDPPPTELSHIPML